MTRVLYVSYTGALQPLGESQVVGYLERLAASHQIQLLTYERAGDLEDQGRVQAMESRLGKAGIEWTRLTYHRGAGPASTAWDVALGRRAAAGIGKKHQIELVHCRSYVASLVGIAVKRATRAKFLFDMRGFWADERIDGGMWRPNGFLYKQAKRYERAFYRTADEIVSLTHAAATIVDAEVASLGGSARCTVIPTCADIDRFKLGAHDPTSSLVIGYLGSAGTWYRFEDTARSFRIIQDQRPDVTFKIANRTEHDLIRSALERHGVDPGRVEITSLATDQVPAFLEQVDATVFFIKPTYSKTASAPTKLAEFLAAGIPCLVNSGVGDMGEIVRRERIGAVVDDFEEASLVRGVSELILGLDNPMLPAHCRAASKRLFSLEVGVTAYDGLYRRNETRPTTQGSV